MDILEKVTDLFNSHDLEYITEHFSKLGFIIRKIPLFAHTPLENRTFIITYKNHTQLWDKWARQSRGTIVYCNEQNRWQVIKYMFPRGAEVLTHFHNQHGIKETENIPSGYLESTTNVPIFDPHQQLILSKLNDNSSEVPGYLTMKADGILAIITFYSGKLGFVIKEIIEKSDDMFAKELISLAQHYNFIPVLSTHKTFNVSDDITLKYLMTSLLVSSGVVTYDELTQLAQQENFTPTFALELYGGRLLEKLAIFYANCPAESESISLCFETICANRTCAWSHVHPELALSYSTTHLKVLSYSVGLTCYPHFLFSDIIAQMGYEEPYWWKIKYASQISSMLQDLSLYIRNSISVEQFCQKYPPANEYRSKHKYLDPEGFVFWSENGSTLDYHKIKSKEYYECHNPKNVKILLEIGQQSQFFPQATNTCRFFHDLEIKLANFFLDLRFIFGLSPHNNVQSVLKISDPVSYLLSSLSEKAQRSFPKQSEKARCNMLMSTSKWSELAHLLFNQYYPSFFDLKLLKSLVFYTEPWDHPNYQHRIHDLIANYAPIIEDLYFSITTANPRNLSPIKYSSFVVYGCPDSTDIDVAVLVPGDVDLTRSIDVEELRRELKNLGYDVNRTLDLNIIPTKGGEAALSSMEDKETQNIIYYTYSFHKQAYPCPIKSPINVDINDKIKSIVKYIIDYLKIFLGEDQYQQVREQRIGAYSDRSQLGEFVFSIIPQIGLFDTVESKNRIKSLTMKIIQLILLERGEYEYTKTGLAVKFDSLYPNHSEQVLWFLYRGNKGAYNPSCLQLLLSELIRITTEHKSTKESSWTPIPIDIQKNSTLLPDGLFSEFINSPLESTLNFEIRFAQLYPTRSINCVFPIECSNIDQLPPAVLNHTICVPQRSPEWLDALKYYTCGDNSGFVPCTTNDWVKQYYNLIRGAIVEMMVIKTGDFSGIFPGRKITRITVGLLVEDVAKQGSKAIAPDLLLMLDDKEIVPVEIKCLVGKPPIKDHAFRRACNIATKQLETSLQILKSQVGLLVFVYIYSTENGFVFEPYCSMISL